MFAKLSGMSIVLGWMAMCTSPHAGEKPKSFRVIGELKSQKNTPDGKNTFIEVLAPGETKPRKYHVLYDPEKSGPIESVLAAVRAAQVGDVVELNWVSTGHGPAINSFAIFRKARPGKIQELLHQRLATVKELATVTKSAYLHGKATFAELAQANTLLLQAELELCETEKERLAVHERAVASAKEIERVAAQLHKSGLAPQASALAARAARLQAEIVFERAKAKAVRSP
jgi:hypothetical protein